MQFVETYYIEGKKKEQLLNLTDNQSGYRHADILFMKNTDAGPMHSDWTGAQVKIYFLSSRKSGRKIFYTLEPVVSQQNTDV